MVFRVHLRGWVALPVIAIAAAGCSDAPTIARREPVATGRLAGSLETAEEFSGPERGFESEILRLERQVSGLGGISVDPATEKVVVYLTDTATAPGAMVTLRRLAPGVNVLPAIRQKLGRPEHMLIRHGSHPFSSLLEWKRQIAVRRVPGLVSLDANEGENLIDVGVLPRRSPQLVLEEIRSAGIPASAVRIRHAEPATDLGGNLWGRYRPASAGLQIEVGEGCTLGLAVTVVNYNQIGYLTAAHCQTMAGQGQLGTKVYQPYNDGTNANWLATVAVNPAWNRTDPECQTTLCSYADVMFAEHNTAAGSFIKRIVATFDWNQHVNDNMYGDILFGSSGWGGFQVVPYVVQGSLVYKVGKTTGITAGYVSKTCQLGTMNHHGVVHTVLCVDVATGASSGPGDSGGPVFYPASQPDPPYAIGIFTATEDGSIMADPDAATNRRCVGNCSIVFAEWSAIQAHLSRYFTP